MIMTAMTILQINLKNSRTINLEVECSPQDHDIIKAYVKTAIDHYQYKYILDIESVISLLKQLGFKSKSLEFVIIIT